MKQINDFQVSKYFNLREFCSPDTGELKISRKLVEICEELRNGLPLIVTSGYRTPEHNKKVGGHKNSYHLQGRAADLKPTLNSLESLFILAASYPNIGGLGIYEANFIHIDLRPTSRIFWVKMNNKSYKYFSNPNSTLEYFKKSKNKNNKIS